MRWRKGGQGKGEKGKGRETNGGEEGEERKERMHHVNAKA